MSERGSEDESGFGSEDESEYQVVVVGGGPAGLTAAIYTTRLGHDTAVVDRGGGRAAMMQDTHNVLGVTEEVSGVELLQTGREQVEGYGADFLQTHAESVERRASDDRFEVETGEGTLVAERVVLATGFTDERPDPPLPPTGRGLHYCLHCDAYMFVDEPVYVMGTGEAAAHVAMIMLNVTDEVDLLTRGKEVEWSDETDRQLRGHPVDVIEAEIVGVERDDDGWLEAFEFEGSAERSSANNSSGQGPREDSVGPRPTESRTESGDGTRREYRGGFPMYGSDYNAELADQLGCERTDDGTVAVDDHGRTSVDGVHAVGDLTPGHNQVPVAMGEGARAGIGIHYDLREFPRSLEAIEADGPVDEDEVPAVSDELLRAAVTHPGHAPRPRDAVEVDDSAGSEAPAAEQDD